MPLAMQRGGMSCAHQQQRSARPRQDQPSGLQRPQCAPHQRKHDFRCCAYAATSTAEPLLTASPAARSGRNGAHSMSSLATYNLQRRGTHQHWLDRCIQDAVRNLAEAPFLQATCLRPAPSLERFRVSSEVASAPQLWEGIVRHLSGTATSSVMYVSPVVLGRTPQQTQAVSCLTSAACNTAQEVLTGIATGEGSPMLSGSIGECCNGGHGVNIHAASPQLQHRASLDGADAFRHGFAKASQIVPYKPSGREATARPSADVPPVEGRMRAGTMQDGQLQQYFGVVVQSMAGSMEGCYVLKTTHSGAAGCQCIHWTLTKLCDSMPLDQQLSSAWL